MLAVWTGTVSGLLVYRWLVDTGADSYLPKLNLSSLSVCCLLTLTVHEVNQLRVRGSVVCYEKRLKSFANLAREEEASYHDWRI